MLRCQRRGSGIDTHRPHMEITGKDGTKYWFIPGWINLKAAKKVLAQINEKKTTETGKAPERMPEQEEVQD